MSVYLNDEHRALRAAVRKFVDEEIIPIAAELDRENKFPLEAYRQMGELGFLAPSVSPEYGGAGADLLSTALVKEEVARGAAGLGMSINVCSLNFCHTLEMYGTEEQKRRYIAEVASGRKLASWMLTEPNAGSDALALQTVARPDGNKYIVKGSKTFITNAPLAEYFICIARLPGTKGARGGLQLLLERGMPGLEVGEKFDKLGMRCSPTSEVFMEDVEVPKANLIGAEGQGFPEMFKTLDAERSMGASTSIGVMQACLEASVKYANQRVQFEKPLAEFQLVQEMIANMATGLEVAREYCYKVVTLCMRGRSIIKEAAIAKLFASQMAVRSALDAVQIHGGYGYIKEYHVERFLRDAKLGEIGGGTSQIQTRLIAKEVLRGR
ncbi:MAG: hypothetical protein A2V67_16000 [Deltaproteobacteria bacterium RBG_13_61_14]|nr:MAG: hypothetical protein A2V67_16000 [Deltaproteobacteria bacterium RBG_13_61_14]